MYGRLNDGGRNFVPFIAIYSTPEHPFGLVFESMEHLDLGYYLTNNPDIPRLKLVRLCCHELSHRLTVLE